MEQSFPVIQIVGFQNSGKTTLMEKLISASSEKGLSVASLKHHGHGGIPETTIKAKDSDKHYQAGAVVAGVEGEGVLQIQGKKGKWTLVEIVEIYRFFQPDILFVEGYKQEHFSKVVIVRNENDWTDLHSLSNILCVITWQELSPQFQNTPSFLLHEHDQYIPFILSSMFKHEESHSHDDS